MYKEIIFKQLPSDSQHDISDNRFTTVALYVSILNSIDNNKIVGIYFDFSKHFEMVQRDSKNIVF